MSNNSKESCTNDSFELLSKEVKLIPEVSFASEEATKNTKARRGKRLTSKERRTRLKFKYEDIFACLRLRRIEPALKIF